MTEPEQETPTTKSPFDLPAENAPLNIRPISFLTPKERDRVAVWDILRSFTEEYEPLEESHLRIIEIQRGIARTPRLDRLIFKIVAELREKVSHLEKQLAEINEVLQDVVKTYNATIYELGTSEYELTMPIQIVLEEYQDETVARIPELNLYASADTDTEAITELKHEVIKLYEHLVSSDRILGPLPKSWLETLRKLIVKKNG